MTRGFFAVGIYHAKHPVNVGSLWRSASLFGAAMVFTVGRRYERRQASDTTKTPQNTPLIHFADIEDLVEHLPWSCPLVGVEMDDASTELRRFGHPTRGAYLLGAEDHGLPDTVLKRCHQLVQIECPTPQSMNVSNAGSLVMYDRYIKEGKV